MLISSDYCRSVEGDLRNMFIIVGTSVIPAGGYSGAPNGNFRENICSEDDLRSRIFGAFVVKFLACLLS